MTFYKQNIYIKYVFTFVQFKIIFLASSNGEIIIYIIIPALRYICVVILPYIFLNAID